MEAIIRKAIPADLSGLLSLYAELSVGDRLPTPEAAVATWAKLLSSEMISVLIIEQGGRAVSSCVLVIVPNLTRDQKPFALIENVVTSAAMRGRGLGKQVIRAAIDEAWAAGCYKVMLMTGRTDPGVLAFYESCGFERGKTAFQIRRSMA
jgi:GNAT superfamily N-acetyltransferase